MVTNSYIIKELRILNCGFLFSNKIMISELDVSVFKFSLYYVELGLAA